MPPKKEAHEEVKQERQMTRSEWINASVYVGAERYAIAGVLHDVKDNEVVPESELRKRLERITGEK